MLVYIRRGYSTAVCFKSMLIVAVLFMKFLNSLALTPRVFGVLAQETLEPCLVPTINLFVVVKSEVTVIGLSPCYLCRL